MEKRKKGSGPSPIGADPWCPTHIHVIRRNCCSQLQHSGSGPSPKRVTLYSLQARLINFRFKIASFILSKRKSKLADISVVEIILKFGRVAGLLLFPRQNTELTSSVLNDDVRYQRISSCQYLGLGLLGSVLLPDILSITGTTVAMLLCNMNLLPSYNCRTLQAFMICC
ncbi:hypothetical protein CPSG_02901 [Coccidioides posadasii str. Silveira]|uniref:Uncharacterized protein n=1 Tax=Coccidioides posadasii (strain RMSCC 757 / Silveira) TaxID=443226 RepID=E9CYN1_COCPS|nr:hypothetical protein CPSG_02901 [Coccidioides posadasii str. Silveira]